MSPFLRHHFRLRAHRHHGLPEPVSKSHHHPASLCAQSISTNANPTLLSCCLEDFVGSPLPRGPSPTSQLVPDGSRPGHLLPAPRGTLAPGTLCPFAWLWAFAWVGSSFCCRAASRLRVNTPPSALIQMTGPLLPQCWLCLPWSFCHTYHNKEQGFSSKTLWPRQAVNYLRAGSWTKCIHHSGVIPATYILFST